MNKSLQKDDMKEFRALGECYRALVEETGRSSALLHKAGQRRTVARDDSASSWTPTKTKSAPTPRSAKRSATPVGAENE